MFRLWNTSDCWSVSISAIFRLLVAWLQKRPNKQETNRTWLNLVALVNSRYWIQWVLFDWIMFNEQCSLHILINRYYLLDSIHWILFDTGCSARIQINIQWIPPNGYRPTDLTQALHKFNQPGAGSTCYRIGDSRFTDSLTDSLTNSITETFTGS